MKVNITRLLDKFHGHKVLGAGSDGRIHTIIFVFKTLMVLLNNIFFISGYRYIVPLIGMIGTFALIIILIRFPLFYRHLPNWAIGTVLALSTGGYLSSMIAEFWPQSENTIFFIFIGLAVVALFSIGFFVRTILFKSYVISQLEQDSKQESFTIFYPVDFDYAAQLMTDLTDEIYKFGYAKFKTSMQMRMFYCTHLLQSGENRHMIHQLTQPHTRLAMYEFDLAFFFSYCKNKKQEIEMSSNQGNKRIIVELKRVKNNCLKIKKLLQEFWSTAAEDGASFSSFPGLVSTIDYLEDKCEKILQGILKIDPNHVGTLRAYGISPFFYSES